MEFWRVTARMVEDAVGDVRVALLAIYLTDGEAEFEVARVAMNRDYSANKSVEFVDQFQREWKKAEQVCDIVNESQTEQEQWIAEKVYETRSRVREILGGPVETPT
jgi:predicted outer membrane protein